MQHDSGRVDPRSRSNFQYAKSGFFHKIDRVRKTYLYFDLRTKKPTCTVNLPVLRKKEVRPHLHDRAKSVRR
jgi:hypothetical protein